MSIKANQEAVTGGRGRANRASHWTRILMVAAMGLALAACGNGVTFTADDLPGLVLQSSEAPAGTLYFQAGSGPAPIERFTQGVEAARTRFVELGFQDGYVRLFRSPDFPLPAPPDPGDISPDAFFIGTGAMLFGDAEAAGQALEVLRSLVIPQSTEGSKALSADDLGDEAVGFMHNSGPVGKPGALYAFRIGNAMFVVAGEGSLEAEDLLAIARKIAARAQG